MRVLVAGRTGRDEWEDANENERVTFKVEARRVGILPCRVEAVTKPTGGQSSLFSTTAEGGSSNRQTPAMHRDLGGAARRIAQEVCIFQVVMTGHADAHECLRHAGRI